MAVTETRSLVNPTLEGSLTAFLKKLDPLGGQAINTAGYAPQVAAQNPAGWPHRICRGKSQLAEQSCRCTARVVHLQV